MTFFWIAVFLVSLILVVKGSDWLLQSAEKIGLSLGMSPFVVGIVIVGIGTSFPELISSLVATLRNVNDVAVANAIGSNVANILLIVGAGAVIAKRLVVSKSLIDLDLPLLAISTVLFLGVAWDRSVNFVEALLLLAVYGVYLAYTIMHREDDEEQEKLPSRKERRGHGQIKKPTKILGKDVLLLIIGIAGLMLGAQYLIESVVKLSAIWNIATGVITVTAVALGTSLPELLVTIKAALQRKSEVALGNIFGSNVFNILVVTGIPGLFGSLQLDEVTFSIGVPALAAATLLFIISGISKRIHIWEGALYLGAYILFIGKLFEIF